MRLERRFFDEAERGIYAQSTHQAALATSLHIELTDYTEIRSKSPHPGR
jgi:hypothetical protein